MNSSVPLIPSFPIRCQYLSYNFTIVGSYRDMDEAPEDEMTDEEAMQQNLEDTENHEVAKAQ